MYSTIVNINDIIQGIIIDFRDRLFATINANLNNNTFNSISPINNNI